MACALLGATQAAAQSLVAHTPFDDDSGQTLFDAEGAEGGARAGNFDVRAAAGLSFGFDNNVYATGQAVRSDELASGQFLLRATDQGPTRSLQLLAHLNARRYASESSQDSQEYGVAGELQRAFGGRDLLEVRFDAARQIESRTDIEAPPLALSPYDKLSGFLDYQHFFNRLSTQLRTEAVRLQYQAAGQQFRDRWQYRAEFAPAYGMTARLRALAVMYFNRDDFDVSGARDSSADTRGLLLGMHYESPDLFALEFAAGYFQRRADDGIDDLDGLSGRASFTWQPTQLTRIETGLLRTDAPTRVPGAFAKIRSDVHLELQHSYSRSFSFVTGLRYQIDEFDGLQRTDNAWIAAAGCSWSLTRHALIDFHYEFSLRDTQEGVRDFDRQLAQLTWVWRL